jgi:hypothetical protein
MTAHPGRADPSIATATETDGGRAMADSYRITVKGVMSERFSRGFPGLASRPSSDRTVLEGGLPAGVRIHDVLAKLDNLGLEVLEVEPLGVPTHQSKEA